MFKKFISVLLSVLLVCSMCSVLIFTGTAAEAPSVSGEGNVFYFDTTSSGWTGFDYIYCHIFAYGGDAFFEWQTKKERCTDSGNGIWTYDLDAKGVELQEGVPYCIMFSADDKETYQMLMDTSCIGDTAYATGNMIENPVDSSKSSYETLWKNADSSKYGPLLAITSIGNVVGTACAPDTAPYLMFKDFLVNTLDNARAYSGKDDQTLLDDTAKALGLNNTDIENAIGETGVAVEWTNPDASVPTEAPTEPPTEKPAEHLFRFDTTSSGWTGFDYIYCHIFAYGGDAFFEWQTKKERCTDSGNGIWTYNLDEKGVELQDGVYYCIMFSAGEKETYQMLMDTSCIGDTAYATGNTIENPVDSNKSSYETLWKNTDNSKYGPLLAITSIGNVVGSVCAPDTTPYNMFVDFLKNTLNNARVYSDKTDQQIVDDTAKALGLETSDIEKAIAEAGVDVLWTPDQPTPAKKTGDVDGDGVVSVLDATKIQKYIAKILTEDDIDLSVGDVDGDGVVSVLDATRIQKYVAKICNLDGTTPYIDEYELPLIV